MSSEKNRLLDLLGISIPILCAPMVGAAGSSLATQVTLSGGFGLLGSAIHTPERLERELEEVRQILGTDRDSPLRVGAGYIGCWLDGLAEEDAKKLIKIALDNRALAVWFSFGNDLQKWVQFVRDYDSSTGRKTIIFVQLSFLEDALVAAKDWNVDVIVAQGVEAGGHGYGAAPPLRSLVSSIVSALPEDGPVILGAGGLVTGGHIAEIIKLGASGVVLGTRFCLTPESMYPDPYKQALISAESSASVRSEAFDQTGNWMQWPRGVDGRALRNATVDDFERGEDVQVLRSKYKEALPVHNVDRVIIWAGAGVGVMKSVKAAKELVQDLYQECLASLAKS
ncbi:2-nitropropane dioxygenase [Macrolepiota fuliginosa MF-IS2]|uniref:2-nitropropane dioxygenase n=1 Tax=Macrolepiota fuliginosa MF-IS2 TaxID=1400762 RepID=A0A9P5X5T7_9AGAR|nr:2-nitropropane dioxygenase [Macrolepiota fuliginosa MF-IS2]